MATRPTPVAKDLKGQQPAPPVDRSLTGRALVTKRLLQRGHTDTEKHNTLRADPRLFVEWVIEDEVENPTDAFLQWPTRQAFVHDRVQVRVQVEDLAIKDGVEFKFAVRHLRDPPEHDPLLFIGTEKAAVDAFTGKETVALQRPSHPESDVSALTTGDTEHHIHWEPAASRSFVVTTIELPHDPAESVADNFAFVARFSLTQAGVTYEADSPPILAFRWWANPLSNLGMPRAKADTIEPLVDSNYFQACYDAIRATVAGDKIYIAGWSFNAFTHLTGGKTAANDAATAATMDGITKRSLLRCLGDAAARGVDTYILLDAVNGPFFEPWVRHFLGRLGLSPADAARIHLRQSPHPKMRKVGIGPFSKKVQFSSYHEKYVIVKGSKNIALVGGIDFMPDRFSPVKHEWKHWKFDYYRYVCRVFGLDLTKPDDPDQTAIRGMLEFGSGNILEDKLMLWHDAAVKIAGTKAISGICADFARRWNEGTGGGAALVQSAIAPEVKTDKWNCQLVLTDNLKDGGPLGTIPGDHFGTWDVQYVAILEARHFVYIENQYCRSTAMRDALVLALKRNPILQVMIIVPFITEETAKIGARKFENRFILGGINEDEMQARGYLHGDYLQHEFLTQVRRAAPDRVAIACLAGVADDYNAAASTFAPGVQMIYPHSKTMVVDDTWAYIGSANANGRSFKLDGEIGFVIHDRKAVTDYRKALWREHFGVDVETRQVRKFVTSTWKAKMIKGKVKIADCTAAELATVKVVELSEPPKGQKYNGPGSWIVDLDDYV